jgi:hypothetical protein
MRSASFFPRPSRRVLSAIAVGAFSAHVSAAPLDLDFGPWGPSIHDVGAVDVGVNVVRAGNRTATGLGTAPSRITFSVPDTLQVDRLTLTFTSFESIQGAFLKPTVMAPNSAVFPLLGEHNVGLGAERDFTSLSITNPGAVSVDFSRVSHPGWSTGVEHNYVLRVYVSAIPEPAAAALFAAGLAALMVVAGQRRRGPRQAN